MTAAVTTVAPGDTLEFVENLMAVERVRHLPVVEDDVLVGLVSNRDILAASISSLRNPSDEEDDRAKRHSHVRDVMHAALETVGPDADLVEAAETMLTQKVGSLPVVEGKRLVGIVTEADFVRIVRDLLSEEAAEAAPPVAPPKRRPARKPAKKPAKKASKKPVGPAKKASKKPAKKRR
jgi:CBS domain-containing membrane protein